MRKNLLFLFLAVLLTGCNLKTMQVADIAPGVIFDTDLGNDIDDVFALQMVLNYANHGKVNLLGVTLTKDHPAAVEYVDSYCRLNGFDNMPLGFAYNGSTRDINSTPGSYMLPALEAKDANGDNILNVKRRLSDDIPEGYRLMRKILSESEDSSVVIITVGFATNLSRLLDSQADEYSELSGKELVARKVKLLSIMSGTYNDDVFNNPEWNVLQDIESAQNVYDNWPGEIIASGSEIGVRILYPHQSVLNDYPDSNYPLCVSYCAYAAMPYDRPCWDLTSVLYAIEPEESHLDVSDYGKIKIDAKGYSTFTAETGGRHRHLVLDMADIHSITQKLVDVSTDLSCK